MFGKFEPVLNATTVGALLSAIIVAVAVFVPNFTTEQQVAVAGLGAALIVIMFGNAAASRNAVTPVEKVVDNVIPFVAPEKRKAATAALKQGKKVA